MNGHPQDERPDPDALLAAITREEHQRGRLKIYLGAAAGVGKTYAMLEEAHALKKRGVDVVAGYVELHGRQETEKLLEGLEHLPRRHLEYRGATFDEMDTEAVIRRHPQIALVDELAHTNAPRSVHEKRYEDIEDILAAGIDVYSTVNVQHLESLNDRVFQLTGVRVRETFPDRIISLASEVVLIDLAPEDLRERIRQGKVYAPGKIEQALSSFFRLGNLVALREIALRETADAIQSSSRRGALGESVAEALHAPPRDESRLVAPRILVAIGPKPQDSRLLRAGWRLAQRLNAEVEVVNVRPGAGEGGLTAQAEEIISAHRRLAKSLNVPFHEIAGGKIAEAIRHQVEEGGFTTLLVGESTKSRWQALWKGSVVNTLVRSLRGVDVYIVADPDKRRAPRSKE